MRVFRETAIDIALLKRRGFERGHCNAESAREQAREIWERNIRLPCPSRAEKEMLGCRRL